MAYSQLPTDLFAGMSEDGTDLTIPLASVPGLSAAEADAVTGDPKEIARAMVERVFQWYSGLASVDQPVAFTAAKAVSLQTSGDMAGKHRNTYTIVVYTEVADENAAPEPSK